MQVLITRPQQDGILLQQMLKAEGIASVVHPLFQIVAGRELSDLPFRVAAADVVIAVSKHAVRFAAQKLSVWPTDKSYLAVGQTTAALFQKQCGIFVESPSEQNSEGLLGVNCLQQVAGKRVLILRGQDGRDLLQTVLQQRGATISYCECYLRQALARVDQSLLQQWQDYGIDTWVITSVEQLTLMEALMPQAGLTWLHQLVVVTVSERILVKAKELGYQEIILSQSASNEALTEALKSIQRRHLE